VDKKEFVKAVKIITKKYYIKERKARPFEILVHGILSTRTKDTTTFPAQKRLLSIADTPEKIVRLPTKKIEKLIYPVGFFRVKAKLLKRACRILITNFDSRVPSNKVDLMQIPGVGEKVASLVLEWGFNMPYIAVDTHVNRISQRLGIVPEGTKPKKTEAVLESMLSPNLSISTNYSFVRFGREVCKPVSPQCGICPVYKYCGFKLKSKYAKRMLSAK
jgi:Predicted EndoIII-related endonuclease